MKQDAVNWKTLCLAALKQIEGLHTGTAFHHRDIRASCLSLEQITGLDYCDGFLIASKMVISDVQVMYIDRYKVIFL